MERSVHYNGQARNELSNTAGADHAYDPPLDPDEEAPKQRFKWINPWSVFKMLEVIFLIFYMS